jgi:diaminopimelate decarboxylase
MSGDLANGNFTERNPLYKYVPYCDQIGGVSVDALVERFGGPLLVFDENILRTTARRFRKAFENYPATYPLWSIKTNYLAAICKIFFEEGWGAEVVSAFEYTKMLKAGIDEKAITLNGPSWPNLPLAHALQNGSVVQIDHWDQLATIERLVEERNLFGSVGVRAWMENPHLEQIWSKFGFCLENGEARRAALRIIANPRLRLTTLHCHAGTQILQPKAYGYLTKKLVDLRTSLHKQTGHLVEAVNVGGGFPSSALLHSEPEGIRRPPVELYARAITNVLNKLSPKLRPRLNLEVGRYLVDEAGYMIARVEAVKAAQGKTARTTYVLNTGIHQLPTAQWYRIGVRPTKPATNLHEVRLAGNTCMSIDYVRDAVSLPHLDVGDKLVFSPVGAYLTQAQSFITLRPAVVLVGCDGAARLIRRREELADVEGLEWA